MTGIPREICCASFPCLLGMVDLGMLVLKILAVAGGAAIGFILSGLLVRILARATVHKQAPRSFEFMAKTLGGIALGVAIYLLAFGTGGSGFGFGSGTGAGGGGDGQGTGGEAQNKDGKGKAGEQRVDNNQAAGVPATGDDFARIDMLGGAGVQQERFYLFEGSTDSIDLTEVRRRLLERKEDKARPPLKGVQINIYKNSVNKNHPAVSELEKWARLNDLTVTLVFPDSNR